MKHQGACHCKAVQFEIESDITQGMTCNCSYCSVRGMVLAFGPRSALTITKGEDNLTTYHFNKKVIDHQFCKTCGIQPFGFGKGEDGSATYAVNLRCVEDVDFTTLPTMEYNGKDV